MTTRDNSIDALDTMRAAAPTLLDKLYTLIESSGAHGLSCDEVEAITELSHQTASPRINELAKAGRIVSTEKRLTRSGRKANIWVAKKENV